MATTTNYGWTTPDDTSLVKDGASAIRSLGTAIDTSLNTALGTKKAGLVLLNTTSFSAVSSISLPAGTFSATYDHYKIIVNGASTAGSTTVRFRTSGTDNSTSNYARQYLDATAASVSGNRVTAQSSIGGLDFRTGGGSLTIEVFNPFATKNTGLVSQIVDETTGLYVNVIAAAFTTTTSFDSMSWIQSGGTVTGTVSVYAYNK